MKPRFPVSVTREFVYRSRIDSTGEILECDSFKTLYRVTRSHLRTEVLYRETEYKYCDAVLEFGYSTLYEITKGHYYSEWTKIHDYGCLQVSTLSESFYSTRDDLANYQIAKMCYLKDIEINLYNGDKRPASYGMIQTIGIRKEW